MQGALTEIDISSIFQLLALGQRTGTLYIEATSNWAWLFFLHNGEIYYALNLSHSALTRLQDYLRSHQPQIDWESLSVELEGVDAEYSCLWLLTQKQILLPQKARFILQSMVQETLFDVLSLSQGHFWFAAEQSITPILATYDSVALSKDLLTKLQEWKRFFPYIRSPEQFLHIPYPDRLQTLLPAKAFHRLQAWVQEHTSIRRLGRILNKDSLAVARAIYPYAQQGLVRLYVADASVGNSVILNHQVAKIVWISEAMSSQELVEGTLRTSGYEVTAIAHPLSALSLIFQISPNFIFCDITLSELNGYDVCAMLRSTSLFRYTPIVLLTTEIHCVDRSRVISSGATTCLRQPSSAAELLSLIGQYVNLGSSFASSQLDYGKCLEQQPQTVDQVANRPSALLSKTEGYPIAGISL
ncbi:MAG: response regulator [Aphanocapsa sp. GSE-SYN-MK-11-07L]|jgi:twitching motility two-component system response regulator PilG|nr:response regulator [Aphanocapsa sp. GSE-SYN-MK-11-07L]